MVLVLSRGSFCPKDRRQAEGLLQLHREMEVTAIAVWSAISTDNITQTNENRSGIGAHWPFLSDPRRVVQKDLDIAEYTDPSHNPMIPHVIVLEPGLVIHKILRWLLVLRTTDDGRAPPGPACCQQEMQAGLGHHNARTQKRFAWQEGRKEKFYPYGKSYLQTLGENRISAGAEVAPEQDRRSTGPGE